jgi:hypothetical protein
VCPGASTPGCGPHPRNGAAASTPLALQGKFSHMAGQLLELAPGRSGSSTWCEGHLWPSLACRMGSAQSDSERHWCDPSFITNRGCIHTQVLALGCRWVLSTGWSGKFFLHESLLIHFLFCSPGTLGNVWRQFWSSDLEEDCCYLLRDRTARPAPTAKTHPECGGHHARPRKQSRH